MYPKCDAILATVHVFCQSQPADNITFLISCTFHIENKQHLKEETFLSSFSTHRWQVAVMTPVQCDDDDDDEAGTTQTIDHYLQLGWAGGMDVSGSTWKLKRGKN